MKRRIFLSCMVFFLVFFASAVYATGSMDSNVDIQVFQQQIQGGGSGSNDIGTIKQRVNTAPHQNAAAIPSEPPREIFVPDMFRKNWHEITRLPYHRLFHFNNWDEVFRMADRLGVTVQNDFFYEAIEPNQNDVVTLEGFPQNGKYLFSTSLEAPLNGFNMPTVVFGASVLKSFTNTERQVVVASLYNEGRNVVNAVATRAGMSILPNDVLSFGFGGGSNTSAGKSRSFCGWILEFYAFSGTGKVSTQTRSAFHPVILNQDGILEKFQKDMEENMSWLRSNRYYLSDAVLKFDIYTLPGNKSLAENIALKYMLQPYGTEFFQNLGGTPDEVVKRLRYNIQTVSPEGASTLQNLGGICAVQMRLVK